MGVSHTAGNEKRAEKRKDNGKRVMTTSSNRRALRYEKEVTVLERLFVHSSRHWTFSALVFFPCEKKSVGSGTLFQTTLPWLRVMALLGSWRRGMRDPLPRPRPRPRPRAGGGTPEAEGRKKKRKEKGIILMQRKAKRFDCDGNEPEIGLI